jgi:hypothetical protein
MDKQWMNTMDEGEAATTIDTFVAWAAELPGATDDTVRKAAIDAALAELAKASPAALKDFRRLEKEAPLYAALLYMGADSVFRTTGRVMGRLSDERRQQQQRGGHR